MIRYLMCLLFILSGHAIAGWSEIAYTDEQENCNKSVLEFDNSKFEIGATGSGQCSVTITSLSDPKGVRYYNFAPDGLLHISEWVNKTEAEAKSYWKYSALINEGLSESDALEQVMTSAFHNSSTKSYYLLPATSPAKVFHDSELGLFKIIAPNGKEFIFDQATGLINEELTTGFNVSQKPLKTNKDGITITDPNGPLITRPYSVGGYNEDKLATEVLVENAGKTCRVKGSEILQGEMRPLHEMSKVNTAIESNCPGFSSSTYDASAVTNPYAYAEINYNYSFIPTGPYVRSTATTMTSPLNNSSPVNRNRDLEQEVDSSGQLQAESVDDTEDDTEEKVEVFNGAVLKDPFTNAECKTKISDFFENAENAALKEEYMKIQGKITLHRVAWTLLKLSASETDTIEGRIQQLIARRDPALYREFVESGQPTKNKKLGFAIMEMKNFSQDLASTPEEQAYALQHSDIKMIDLLVKAEGIHGRKISSGVMDFTSIIKNELKGKFENKTQNLATFKETIDELNNDKSNFESKLTAYLKTVDCTEITNASTCEKEEITESILGRVLQSSEDIVDFVYDDKFNKEQELKDIYQWNNYWLQAKE